MRKGRAAANAAKARGSHSRVPHVRRLKAGDDGDRVDAGGAQRADLPLDGRAIADAREALGPIADHAAQAAAAAGGQDHGSHAPSGTAAAGVRRCTSSRLLDTYMRRCWALMPKKTNTSAYRPAASASSTPIANTLAGTRWPGNATKAVITAAGQVAGHTASANARPIDSCTRRQPAGKRTSVDARHTGTNVPIATPTRPSGLTMAMLNARLAMAAATVANATSRCSPAPFSNVAAVAAPIRTITVNESRRSTTTLPVNPGPTHASTSGSAMSIIPPAIGITVASDNRVPW